MTSEISDISDVGSGILNDPTSQKPFRLNRKKVGFTWSCPVDSDENPISDISDISDRFDTFGRAKWLIATELHENGKKHFHAWVCWEKNIDTKNVRAFDINGVHPNILDPGRGWLDYCKKHEDFVANFKVQRPMKLIDPDKWWQKEILATIQEEPDDRTVHWYWSSKGCIGKTQFQKYCIVKHDVIILGGKGADVRDGVVQYVKKNRETPDIVFFNITRSYDSQYLNYEGIENVKDMCFYSGKYEGGMVCGPSPHVVVFSNEPPDESKLSEDRWHIVNIDELRDA